MNSTARAADALEAFQNHCVRKQWDTRLSQAGVEGGGTHPYRVRSRSLSLNLFAVAFWLGVVAVEYLIERSRAQSRSQGFTVARLHRKIDLFFEMPAFSVVLVTGILLIEPSRFDGIYAVKVFAGGIAVIGNLLCLVPVLKRRAAAENDDLSDVIRQSRLIDIISLAAIPAGLLTLACGVYLMLQR